MASIAEAAGAVDGAGEDRAARRALSTGRLSPVSMDSSTADSPSSTVPSTGMRSPGRTTTMSPGRTSSTGDFDFHAVAQHARGGRLQVHQAADGRARRWPRARASSVRPSRISAMMTAAASK